LALVSPAQARGGIDKRAAAGHFQRGRALFEAGSFATALDEFNAGYEAYPLPGFLVNIGQCLRKLDRLDEASDAFQRFLGAGGDPRLRAEVQEAISEIAEERARRAPPAVVATPAPPPSAPARLDLTPPPPSVTAPSLTATTTLTASAPPPKKKSRKWVWAVVGVVGAAAVGAAVGVAVLETQPQQPRPGSLGVLDARR
jgi:hypothetical protein